MQIIPYCIVYRYTTAQKFGVFIFMFLKSVMPTKAHQKHIKNSKIVKYYHNLK